MRQGLSFPPTRFKVYLVTTRIKHTKAMWELQNCLYHAATISLSHSLLLSVIEPLLLGAHLRASSKKTASQSPRSFHSTSVHLSIYFLVLTAYSHASPGSPRVRRIIQLPHLESKQRARDARGSWPSHEHKAASPRVYQRHSWSALSTSRVGMTA
jgi:hypothetical protein